MKTIEERAYEYFPNSWNGDFDIERAERIAWIDGATEQKEIDIKRFLSLIDSLDVDKFYKESQVLSDGSRIPSSESINRLRKVLEDD